MNLKQFNRILLRALLLPVLSLAVVAGVLLLQVLHARRTVTAIQVSDDIIAATTEAQTLLVDEETGLRGYQITADPAFLQPYEEALPSFARLTASLHANLMAQRESTRTLDGIDAGEQTWTASYAQPLIAQIGAGGNANDPALNMSGKEQMDGLRVRVRQLLQRETELRVAEVRRWHKEVQHTVEALLLLALLAGIVISVTTVRSLKRVSGAYQKTLDEQREAQAALVATEKLATAGRLAANIAHEMHNPLDSVVNLLYLLRDERDPVLANEYVDLAQAELTRMGEVSRAMLGLYNDSVLPDPVGVSEVLRQPTAAAFGPPVPPSRSPVGTRRNA